MRLDSGNRGFVALVGASLVAYLAVGLAACALLTVLGYRVATDGLGVLAREGEALWPALVFLGLVGSGAVLGVRSVVVQMRSSVRLAQRVRGLGLAASRELEEAARRTGLAGRVRVVDAPEGFSFAYGALTPRVAVSSGLIDAASPSELEAVLTHERYHVRNLDPLKVLVVRALPAAFFYLPALAELRGRYVAGRELAADRRALEAHGRAPLAGALFKVMRGPGWQELNAAAAIGGPELLDVRISQLETGREPALKAVSPRGLALTALGALTLTFAVLAPLFQLGGPFAAVEAAAPEMGQIGAADVLLATTCVLPWLGAALLGYGLLARRAASPLDTTRS